MAVVTQPKPLSSRRIPFAIHINLDRTKDVPLQRQIYDQVREAILAGRMRGGSPLPSTRSLASELGCARNTILGAFDQLLAEGYVTGRRGAGTFIANLLPESAPRGPVQVDVSAEFLPARLSDIGETIAGIMPNRGERFVSFVPSVPEIGMFPFATWGQLLSSTWANPSQLLATHLDARGWAPLREAIAQHLRSTRMVVCDADQIVVTSGAQHSIDMVARLLLNPGDVVWTEDPGYSGTRAALLAAGMRIIPVALDESGIDIMAGRAAAAKPRMIIVAPSHQYPLGCVMSLRRRLELIAFAESADALVLEDDYDSEFRFTGEPLASLQGLDAGRRTIYVGTFSKMMFPAVRTGFVVLPRRFAEAFSQARAGLDIQPSIVSQPALTEFMREGYLAAHVRRMRMVYMKRQQALIAALDKFAGGVLTAEKQETGLHLIAHLAKDLELDDRQASMKAQAGGIAAPPLADYFADGRSTDCLLLGFGTTPESVMDDRVLQLVHSLKR